MKKKNKLCFLCGKEGADTRDHIPPRGIFPLRPEGQLITVPAHKMCNAKYQKDDELFRNLIIGASYRTKEGKTAWQKQVVESWKSNPGAKKELQDLLFTAYINDEKNRSLIPVNAIKMDVNLVERQVQRWTRGLYYKKFQKPLPQISEIKVDKLTFPEYSISSFEKYLFNKKIRILWHHIEPNVFSYTLITSNEAEDIGFAIFVFFKTEVYLAAINVHTKQKSIYLKKA